MPDPFAADRSEHAGPDDRTQIRRRTPFKAELETVHEPDRPDRAGRVVGKTAVMQNPDDPTDKVLSTRKRIYELSLVVRVQTDGHGINREITAEQILAYVAPMHTRQRTGHRVDLGAGRRAVDADPPVRQDNGRGPEPGIGDECSSYSHGKRAGKRDCRGFNNDIDIVTSHAPQQIPHDPADQIHADTFFALCQT